ncbi:predicted protein [Naegleria gruberi]|uniref:Predicted protein n=1 Tax=Naegleria gruberi TaxID=5762 RepID=D2W4M5_NAEGR|nr:uncharacterized protein NAEGRDRAFT_76359 [Naegleria gruberi]EFC35977.1 predicted protein [Naegleria gruberi]|eukprot:XP_002668721.1 predicted protein [Naegleria gruberi strain NEG-M]
MNKQLEEASTTNSELMTVYHSQKHEFNLLSHEYEILTFKTSQYDSKIQELDQLQDEIKTLKAELNERNEDKKKIRILEAELQKASESLQSQEVLKEAIKDFESELTKLEVLRIENSSLESKLYNTESLLKSWESAFPNNTPSDVNYNIKLQAKKITRLEETIQEVNQEKFDIAKHVELDVIENNRFRLSSMYAESPEDYLIFESDGNAMKLLNSEFACSLEEKSMRFLKNFRSIPGFLCSITLDLFNKQTVFTQ